MKETYAGLIYGQPGVGKTTLALSSVNPVCIDVDRGMYRVERRYQVPSLQVENYQQVLDLLNSSEIDGFTTVIIDTLGKLVDRMGEYVIKTNPKYRQSNGQLTMQGWGQVKIEFRALVKLIGGRNKSVIFVAHESEEKEDTVTKKRPDVSGSARKDIVKELDFMGYMEMPGNKRTISFAPSGAYYAKNSLGLDAVIEIQSIQTANSFIKDIVVSAIKRKKEQDEAQAGPYDAVIKMTNDIVSAAHDVPAINEACGMLAGLNHIWDSKIYAWSKITAAAEALGAIWDKAAKRFIVPAAAKSPPEKPTSPPSAPVQKAKGETERPLSLGATTARNVAGAAQNATPGTAQAEATTTKKTPEPTVPAMYDEPEEDDEDFPPDDPGKPVPPMGPSLENVIGKPDFDDGFEDDIPEPAKGKGKAEGLPSLSEQFRNVVNQRTNFLAKSTFESVHAGDELDIF
jgi:hypothetical protein